jgi:hypothetical protein
MDLRVERVVPHHFDEVVDGNHDTHGTTDVPPHQMDAKV